MPVTKIIASSHWRVFQFTLSPVLRVPAFGCDVHELTSGFPKGLINVVRMVGSTSKESSNCNAGETMGYHKPFESHQVDMLMQNEKKAGN